MVALPTTPSEMCPMEDVLGTGLQIAGGCLDRSVRNLTLGPSGVNEIPIH